MKDLFINFDGNGVFDSGGKNFLWKGRYPISYCYTCDTWTIKCLNCGGTNCNCHSCHWCEDELKEFSDAKVRIESYLTAEESAVYQKSRQLKKFIGKSLAAGKKKIDWQFIHEQGWASDNDYDMFVELQKFK